jgi:3-hydroxybutyryl-CoA dehydratase
VTLEQGTALKPVIKEITQAKINRYAEAGGDGNPLHTDEEFAKGTQFGGTIAHGLLVLAYLSEMLTSAFGEAWAGGGRMKVRFRAPARPGDTVTASGQVTGVQGGRTTCAVECRNQAGEVLVSGEAEVTA